MDLLIEFGFPTSVAERSVDTAWVILDLLYVLIVSAESLPYLLSIFDSDVRLHNSEIRSLKHSHMPMTCLWVRHQPVDSG